MGHEIADEVAEDEEHGRPGGVSEFGTHAEEAEVEEEDTELVTEEGEEVEVGRGVVPLRGDVSVGRWCVGAWIYLFVCDEELEP